MKKKIFKNKLSSIAKHIRNFIRKINLFRKGNYFITNEKSYVDDGLATNHVTDFLCNEKFMKAYNEGEKTGALKNHVGNIHYRAYIACYFAKYCVKLEGDFVECGVGKGLLSKTIVSYLNFEKTGKTFFLFDTFEGIPTQKEKIVR